ncbi:MAG: secretion protein, partial [Flavobacteriales bacterium]
YESKDNTIRLVDTKEGFGNYQIFDFSGKLIQQGVTKEQVIKLNNNTKGGYLIKFEHKGKTASFKFLR